MGAVPALLAAAQAGGSLEILAHRILWSVVVVVALLAFTQGFRWARELDRKRVLLLGLAAALITINWGMFIYGVNSEHVVETSLGYFINPLVTVALAVTVWGRSCGARSGRPWPSRASPSPCSRSRTGGRRGSRSRSRSRSASTGW